MKLQMILLAFFLFPVAALAETENFTSSATMNTTSPFCNVTAPVNGSYETGIFTVEFRGTDYVALSWIALFERNDTTGSFGAWQMLWNQTGPANNTDYPVLKTNITGNYTLQYYCNLTSASLSSAVSTTNTVYVDTILPTLNWTMPSTNNSSFASYGEGWFVNVTAQDFTLSVCNISVYDSVGNLSYNATRTPVAGVCHFTDIISTLNHPTGSWTFRIYVADAAGNSVTEARTAWLYTQNTSHTVWSRSDDPLRTREWIISKGMLQNITEHYHTNITGNLSGHYPVSGYFGPQFGEDTLFYFGTSGMGLDWLNDTNYAVLYTFNPGAVYSNFQVWDFNGHLISQSHLSVFNGYVSGLECSYADQRDDFCIYMTMVPDLVPDESSRLYMYHLQNATSTLVWEKHRSTLPHSLLVAGFARVGNYFYMSNRYTRDVVVVDLYGNVIADYPNALNSISEMLYSDGTYIFAADIGMYPCCSTVDVYDVAMHNVSRFYVNDTDVPNKQARGMMVKGSAIYFAQYTRPEQNSSYFELGNSIAGADCRFTSSQHNITNAVMTELSPGYYNYNYTESVADGTPVYYDATCSASGFETSTDPGVYYTGNWQQPSGYSGLQQYLDAPAYFDGSFDSNSTTCSLVKLQGNDVKAYVSTLELFAYYSNNSSLPLTAQLSLWNGSEGQPTEMYALCNVNVTESGWVNCTTTSTESLLVNGTFYACVNDSSGLATKLGGHGYINGSWIATSEVAVTLQSPWNVDVTQKPPEGGTFTTSKFIIATATTLYTTDFVNKQLEWFGSASAGWSITHVSSDQEGNVVVRMLASNNTCLARRYSYSGLITAENLVDCAATSAGIHSVHGAYWAFGYAHLYRSDTLSNFQPSIDFTPNQWSDGFNCTSSQIEYDDNGDGYIVCIDTHITRYAPLGQNPVMSAIAWAHVNQYQAVKVVTPTQALNNLQLSYALLLNWAKTVFFSNTVDKSLTILFADPNPLSDTYVYYLNPNDGEHWLGGQTLAYQKWNYGVLGYGGNWVFSYQDGSNSRLTEFDRSSGNTREIRNANLNGLISFAKFTPSLMNFDTSKQFIDIMLTTGSTCTSCEWSGAGVTGGQLHINDVMTGMTTSQVFDTNKQVWRGGPVPGMTVGVYLDDAYEYTYDMVYSAPNMVVNAQHSIALNGTKLTLKFYSYGVLQDTQDYYMLKSQIVIPSHSELVASTPYTDFFPNPFYYNNKVYVLPYVNTYTGSEDTDTPFTFNVSLADPSLKCYGAFDYETGGTSGSMLMNIEKLGKYYFFSMPKPFALSTPGQNVTISMYCQLGHTYEMNVSQIGWQYTNETFGFKVKNWQALGNVGTFKDYQIVGTNNTFSYDVCVGNHPLLNYVSSVPSKFYVNPNVGDPTGWTYAVNWSELARYSFSSSSACFSGPVAFNVLPNALSSHSADYIGRYMMSFSSHNASVLPKVVWQGSTILPSECTIYDISLATSSKRENTFTAFFACKGAATTIVWEFTIDGSIYYTSSIALPPTPPEGYQIDNTGKFTFYVYPDAEAADYASVQCGQTNGCAKFVRPVGSSMSVDVKTTFADRDGNMYPQSSHTESFVITVGASGNGGAEPTPFWGSDLLNSITDYAVKNPLSFLLAVVLIVVLAPLVLVLIR